VRAAAAVLLLAAASPAAAADLFGGYSSLRLSGDNVRGGSVGLTWRQPRTLRFTAELSAQLGSAAGEDVTALALLAGPTYVPWRSRRVVPFLHAQAGPLVWRRQVEAFGVAIGPDGVCDGSCPWSAGLVAEAGGGLDLRFTPRLSARVPQADYRWTRLSDRTERGLRLTAGLVYRLAADESKR
jgi:hypothetical protein